MRTTMVNYRVKPHQAARNEELVRRVYEELHERAPAGMRYATYVLDDGMSFIHVAAIETDDERNPLLDVAAFRAFQENINERCDEAPVTTTLREIGSYHLSNR